MELHSGHGLDYENVQEIATLPKMKCLNIGFSIISRSEFEKYVFLSWLQT